MDDSNDRNIPLSPSPETMAAVLANRCHGDPVFDEDFRKDSQSALQKAFGTTPSSQQIRLYDNDNNNWHIVLPNLKMREKINCLLGSGKSLDDEDIANIVGGDFGIACVVTLLIGAALLGIGLCCITAGAIPGAKLAKVKKARERRQLQAKK